MQSSVREKLGINKNDCGDKFERSHVYLHIQAGNRLLVASCLASFFNLIHFQNSNVIFLQKIDTADKMKYVRVPKNTEIQQENTKENTR